MATVNLPRFGKIKMNGVWNDFHESDVITGTISNDYCKFKIEEFKPKMNTYKMISGEAYPTLERLMTSQSEVKSESLREACCKFMKTQSGYEFFGYILHVETLNLFYVQYFRELDGREYFREYHKGKLEKPKMKIYKIIPNQNKHPDSITYEFMMSYFTVESDSPVNAFRKYYECNGFAVSLDLFGYVFDTESLDLYYASWSVDEQIGYSSFAKKLDKPIEKPKMNNYRLIPNQKNLNPSYEEMMASEYLIEAHSPKNAFIGHRTINPRWGSALILDTETLDLYRVSFSATPRREITANFIKKLEKPELKMKTFKILSGNITPLYENFNNQYEINASSIKSVVNRLYTFALTLDVYFLDIETLDLYHVKGYREDISKDFILVQNYAGKVNKPEVKPKPMNNLSFKTLTEANNKRLPLFKNSKGLPAHSKPDGSDWSHAEWLQAVIGELGEYANIMKKVQRGDMTMEEAKPLIKEEIADVQTYFSILATQLDIDLGEVTQDKFNKVSEKVKADVFIKDDVIYSKNEEIKTASEKKEELKVIKSIKVRSLVTNNVRYFSNSSSNFKNELQSVPKSILLNHKPYKHSIDCIKVNDLLQFIFDDYSTLSYIVTEITYEEDNANKKELRNELNKLKVKVKKENLTAQLYHKPVSFSSEQIVNPIKWNANLMIGIGLAYLGNQFRTTSDSKPAQKFITLQDLNNGKVYTQPFKSGFDSTALQELSKLIVKDATVMKTLRNGNDYDGFNVNIGDMIQFSDERNVLYSLRVTKIE